MKILLLLVISVVCITFLAGLSMAEEHDIGSISQPLIVHLTDTPPAGEKNLWPADVALNLTYCVSTAFGNQHREVVQAMQSATRSWDDIIAVRFIYRPTQDDQCNGVNPNVVFYVEPMNMVIFAAYAFLPNGISPNMFTGDDAITIDPSAFGPNQQLTRILAHELGHVLGFIHEHIRPEAQPTGGCVELDDWLGVTSYDSSSVMHYDFCNGTGDGELTNRDYQGAVALYGSAPPLVQLITFLDM